MFQYRLMYCAPLREQNSNNCSKKSIFGLSLLRLSGRKIKYGISISWIAGAFYSTFTYVTVLHA